MWFPEIMYEEDVTAQTQGLPFIIVPKDEVMPWRLLFWEQRDTGEIEPGPSGEDLPVYTSELRQYVLMDRLRECLTDAEYDKVRAAVGLVDKATANKKGKELTEKVINKLKNK